MHKHEYNEKNNEQQGKLLILNGPFCNEKEAIGNVFAQIHGFVHINGTIILNEVQKTNKVATYNDIHADILREINKHLKLGKDVIVSQTILPSYEVLYNYYFHKHKIDSEMIVLLPELDNVFDKNDELEKSFDEEFLEEMHQLFAQEESWTNRFYQYNGEESAIQIAETLHMCFCPQEQKQSFFDMPFRLHSTSKSIKVCE